MPPVQSDVATKEDVARSEGRVREELRAEVASIRAEMATKADLALFRVEMAADLAVIRGEMATKADLAELTVTLSRELAQHVTAAMEDARSWFRAANDETRAVARPPRRKARAT